MHGTVRPDKDRLDGKCFGGWSMIGFTSDGPHLQALRGERTMRYAWGLRTVRVR